MYNREDYREALKKERNATCIQMNGDFARQKFRALQQLW